MAAALARRGREPSSRSARRGPRLHRLGGACHPLLLLLSLCLVRPLRATVPSAVVTNIAGPAGAATIGGEASNLVGGVAAGGGVYVVPLQNYMNSQYYGEVFLGTPGQLVRVLLDTGSSALWVPNQRPHLSQHNIYDHGRSSTYSSNGTKFRAPFGAGAVNGVLSRDDLAFRQVAIPGITFAEVYDASNLGAAYFRAPFDGVLGLGLCDSAAAAAAAAIAGAEIGGAEGRAAPGGAGAGGTVGMASVLSALAASGALARPVFSLFLGSSAPPNVGGGGGGELVLGGVDARHFVGNFTFLPLTSKSSWQVSLDSVALGSTAVSAATAAVLDSGTAFVAGPGDEVRAIAKSLGAWPVTGKGYRVKCSADLPDLVFSFSGQDFVLRREDLILEQSFTAFCILALAVIDELPGIDRGGRGLWILGGVFLRRYYTQFDFGNRRIGLATSSAATAAVGVGGGTFVV